MLDELILGHTDNLSRTLQHKAFSAVEEQEIVRMTIETPKTIRSGELLDLFWSKCLAQLNHLMLMSPSYTSL